MLQRSVTPFWRDIRVVRIASQILFLAVLAGLAYYFIGNMNAKLVQRGMGLNFGFLSNPASFAITGSPIPYTPADPYTRALLIGFLNTLRVAIIGIPLATVLGVFVGISRISTNWLVARIAAAYVEVLRNTPLLVQCTFWYFAVFASLPRVAEQIVLPGPVFLNVRGIYLVWFERHAGFGTWALVVLAALVVGAIIFRLQTKRMVETGAPGAPFLTAAAITLGAAAAAWFLLPGDPLSITRPVVQGSSFSGGAYISPEFGSLLFALVFYTSAFIAEIVRAGIQAVSKGQREAAMSMGLRPGQVMRLVILPQALRVIIPPLTSQYLNLTKNSSLAAAIAYRDVFSIGITVFNQTGRTIEIFVILMVVYLTFSLTTSLIMNLYNRSVRLIER